MLRRFSLVPGSFNPVSSPPFISKNSSGSIVIDMCVYLAYGYFATAKSVAGISTPDKIIATQIRRERIFYCRTHIHT